jgi:hypothetical protein
MVPRQYLCFSFSRAFREKEAKNWGDILDGISRSRTWETVHILCMQYQYNAFCIFVAQVCAGILLTLISILVHC